MYLSILLLFAILAAIAGLCLAILSQRYWFVRAWRFAGRVQRPALRKWMRGALLAMLMGIALVALIGVIRNMRGTISHGSWWLAFFGFWLSSSIVAYLLIKMIAGADWLWRRLGLAFSAAPRVPAVAPVPTRGVALNEGIDHSRRHFVHAAGFLAGAVPFVSFAYGFLSERFRFETRQIDIPIANLPAALEGLRITQLSDIHIGSYMPVSQVRRAVDMANELGGDLAVVTGDFLTVRTDPLEDCIAELSRLRAPLGVWGCNGNHEIYARAEAEAAALFQRFGMRLLRHENAELRWQGSAFNLIGVDYQRQPAGQKRPPMLRSVEGLVRRDVPNILLSHNPNTFPRAAELGIELSLAGHTHGGQVRVEILDHSWSPAQFLTPYVAGLYQRPLHTSAVLRSDEIAALPSASGLGPPAFGNVYVSRGLGTIGAPVRLGVPPEITLITLRRA
jgi:predicted MPP superfamily phosphohydrolase